MIYTLETMQANNGDSLILHYGETDSPKFIVIDGGPANIYTDFLKPRLLQIREHFNVDRLPLSLVMVSHMDDDHVVGIVDLMDELEQADDNQEDHEFEVQEMWFNTFDDIVNNKDLPLISGLAENASLADVTALHPIFANLPEHEAAVIATTAKGRNLRDAAERLNISINNPFDPIENDLKPFVRGDIDDAIVEWDKNPNLDLHVINPDHALLLKMRKKWEADLKKAHAEGDDTVIIQSFSDGSPFNLASIVVLVRFDGKTIFLTGDARGDHILEGLRAADLMDANDHIHVDIFKVPHHGSDRNVTEDFFKKVTADHYVISGNGAHHNPDIETLEMIANATAPGNDFTMHFTNHSGSFNLEEKLDNFIAEQRANGRTYGIEFRDDDALSLKIDLLDPVNF